jgi:hypothetical protein
MKTKYDITFGTQFDRNGNALSDVASSKLAILGKAAKTFGGCTWTAHEGSYLHDDKRLVVERSATVSIIVDHLHGDVKATYATEFAEWIRKVLNQESVLVAWTELNAIFVREG